MTRKMNHIDSIRRSIEIELAAKHWGIKYNLPEYIRPRTAEIAKLATDLTLGAEIQGDKVINCYRWVVEEVDYPWRELPNWLGWLMLFADLHILFRHPVRPRLNISLLEHWKFPEETAHDRAGDCEDTSILLCSLLRAAGIEGAWVNVGTVKINGQYAGHAWVTWGEPGEPEYLFETTLDHLPANPWQFADDWPQYRPELRFNDTKVVHLPVRFRRSRLGRLQAAKHIKRMWVGT